MGGPLQGIKVLDLSRVLAGPWATQIMADFGACVWKIERPGIGDDTRQWGPPYLKGNAHDITNDKLSAYFLSTNRGKYSIELDITSNQHRHIFQKMIQQADVLVENFKVGSLAKYQLDYDSVQKIKPDIIYVSITGFGQTGPDATKPGYDAMIQARGGLMSITGEPTDEENGGGGGGGAQKVGVAVADLMTGMYAVTGTLAALYHRDAMKKTMAATEATQTQQQQQNRQGGQHIDVALLDTQVAMLANQNMNYLVSGTTPTRYGTAHPNIVPYQSFTAQDGHEFMLAVGNDKQFQQCVMAMGRPELAYDERFHINAQRVHHRQVLIPIMSEIFKTKTCQYWLDTFSSSSSSLSLSSSLEDEEKISIPCSPIQNIAQVFDDEQVKSRQMRFDLYHPALQIHVPMVANPIKFSKTPIEYKKPPPLLGQDTKAVIQSLLQNSKDDDNDECQE